MISVLQFRTVYKNKDHSHDEVLVAPKGEAHQKTQTWHRISRIRPPEHPDEAMAASLSYKDMVAKWDVIGPKYEAWKKGMELPETGTPLAAWPGVSPPVSKALLDMGIRTVEDVSEMGDGATAMLRVPNARSLPGLAKKWLEGTSLSEEQAKNADLMARIAAMEEMLAAQVAEKPKRGRPRKQPEAVDQTEDVI